LNNESVGGLGLGLFICKQIVEAHGGDIVVESALSHGTTFTVRVPLERP
jgi:two-component system CheB/CheR fusion protein